MVPLTIGFLILGPLSGYLSDRFGSRAFATGGMLVTTAGFIGLLLVLGIGMGMFAAPNTTAIMNAVPPEYHGVSSGMRATFQNVASTLSITVIFSLVTIGLASALPDTMYRGLTHGGIPAQVANMVAHLPPTGALFAAFLGYNPMGTLLPPAVLQGLPSATRATILGQQFFPNLISGPFMTGVVVAFSISAALSFTAAVISLFRGKRYIYGQDEYEGMRGMVGRQLSGVLVAPLEDQD